MSPIIPSFCQNIWIRELYPALNRCSGLKKAPVEQIINHGWPVVSSPVDPIITAIFNYLKDVKSDIRTVLKKAKGAVENCTIFVGFEFPEYKKRVLHCFKTQIEFDENNAPIGKWQGPVQAAMQGLDKKLGGLAMKFGAFVLDKIKEVGKDAALSESLPFNEEQVLTENSNFLFENMPNIKKH